MATKSMLAGATLLAVTLSLPGCGRKDDAASTGVDGSMPQPAASSSQTTVDYGPAREYVGGAEGPAHSSKQPITIGWINQQGGAVSHPDAMAGFEAAVATVNEHLGGIAGHPLQAFTCRVSNSEEEVQKCAQQMYNNKAVPIVLLGPISLATGPLHQTLARAKPMLGVAPGPRDLAAENAYYPGSGPVGAPAAMTSYAIKELGAKRIAVIGPDFAGSTIAIQAVQRIAQAAGATVTSGTYKQGAADVTPSVIAAGARNADAVLVLEPSAPGCIALGKTLTLYGIKAPIISLSSCAEDAVAKGLGDLAKWTYALPSLVPSASVPEPNAEIAVYLAAMKTHHPESTVFGSAPNSFSLLMLAVRVMNQLGPDAITAENLSSALARFEGPMFISFPKVQFGRPAAPAVGSFACVFYQYDGEGRWTPAAGGRWIE